ncbi:MAG: beta-galactosidase [Peptostreptococcaceae bacterium]|nr:beta-galactosidase [Peptostreptococcaceae bacterium]
MFAGAREKLYSQDKQNVNRSGFTFSKNCYYLNGKPTFLYSGEFHYFRVPRKDWKARLTLFKEAGGNCVATYTPWLIHEPTEGKFFFSGDDGVRDLEGFLKTCKEMGLYVIVRPGPYQYSELKHAGLPGWLVKNYPEIRAKNINNEDYDADVVSYLHPIFLEKTRAWFNAICPIIKKYSVDNGGPIVFVQLDNETDGLQIWDGGMDYNATSMGFGKKNGRYPVFLQAKYKDISALNKAYNTDYKSFENVLPVDPSMAKTNSELRRVKDYADFYFNTISEYFQALTKMIRDNGIKLSVISNSWSPNSNTHYYEAAKALGSSFLLGVDHYYNLGQSWEQNNPTPQLAAIEFASLEALRVMGFPPTVLEMPAGSLADWPVIGPKDFETNVLTNIAFGLKGLNYYIFTGGPNPPGMGTTSDVYDYGAPISANGEIRPLYQSVKKIGHFLKEHEWLSEAKRQFDCRIAFNYRANRSQVFWKNQGNVLFTDNEAWDFLRKGVLTSSLCASLSPVFCNLENDEWTNDTVTPVIVVSSSCMSASQQQRIVNFLKKGGKVLLTPVVPVLDDNFNPCTILSDFLGKPEIAKVRGLSPLIDIGSIKNIFDTGGIFVTKRLPENAEIVGKDENSNSTLAWTLNTPHGGKVVFLGFYWEHAKFEHENMIHEMMDSLGLKQKVDCSNPNVWTSILTKGNKSVLFVMNLFVSKQITKISFGDHVWDNFEVPPMTVKMIEF